MEANEAFAAQHVVNKDLGWDVDKVNVNGAIAIGHPVEHPGAYFNPFAEMARCQKGLATLCIGGGMGIAMCVERD